MGGHLMRHDFVGLPADVIFCPGYGLIRLFQTAPGEERSVAGHVAGYTFDGNVVQAALPKVTEQPIHEAMQGPMEVWRHTGLAMGERREVATYARGYIGRRYGMIKLGLQLGDNLLARSLHLTGWHGEIYAFRRLQYRDNYPNCHWVWAAAYERALGYLFGMHTRLTSPDAMHDWVMSRAEWRKVYPIGTA